MSSVRIVYASRESFAVPVKAFKTNVRRSGPMSKARDSFIHDLIFKS